MKKFLTTLLAAIMLVSLSACGDETTLDDLLDSLESLDSSTSSLNEENSSHDKAQEDGSQADASQVDASQVDGSQMEGNQEGDKEDNSTFYSTNDLETAKKGNSGIFAYRSKGGTYYRYWIIDFDEGYVYSFRDGNDDSTCDRLKIEDGDLNSLIIITYHAGGDTWQNALHFKWARQPEHLILEDNDHFEYDFYATDLDEALTVRDTKTITDY